MNDLIDISPNGYDPLWQLLKATSGPTTRYATANIVENSYGVIDSGQIEPLAELLEERGLCEIYHDDIGRIRYIFDH